MILHLHVPTVTNKTSLLTQQVPWFNSLFPKCKCVTADEAKINRSEDRSDCFEDIRPFSGDTQDMKEDQWFVRMLFTDIRVFSHEMFALPSSRVRLVWPGEYQGAMPRSIWEHILKSWSPSLGERVQRQKNNPYKNHKCVLHLNCSDFHSLALMFQEMGFFFLLGLFLSLFPLEEKSFSLQ